MERSTPIFESNEMNTKDFFARSAIILFACLVLYLFLGICHTVVLYYRLPSTDGAYNVGLIYFLCNPFVVTVILFSGVFFCAIFSPLLLYFFWNKNIFRVSMYFIIALLPIVLLSSLVFNVLITLLITSVSAAVVGALFQLSTFVADAKTTEMIENEKR